MARAKSIVEISGEPSLDALEAIPPLHFDHLD
jgi:hypothetical protein